MARILVVDNEVDVCKGICESLSEDGHEVLSKFNSKEARDFLKKERQNLDVAIIDMFMEEPTSGLDLIKFISRNHLPVASIVLTGHGSEQIGLDSMNAGAYNYIVKGGRDQTQRIRLAVHGAALAIAEKRHVAKVFAHLKRCFAEFQKQIEAFEAELCRISHDLPELEEA